MTIEAEPDPPCNNCGHVVDAHEDGGDCQEEGCECTEYSVLVPQPDEDEPLEDEPIPETRGPV